MFRRKLSGASCLNAFEFFAILLAIKFLLVDMQAVE